MEITSNRIRVRAFRFLLFIVMALCIVIPIKALADQTNENLNYVDLNTWSSHGDGTWVVESGGRTVTQTINGNPTFFLSPEDYIDVLITGTVKVNTTSDDDFIGFVMGYENTGNYYDFNLFDWKQSLQDEIPPTLVGDVPPGSVANEGFTLSHFYGELFDTDYAGGLGSWSKYFWYHIEETNKYDILDTQYGPGTGWEDFKEYEFKILYTQTQIKISIDDEIIFDVSGVFQTGKIGLYNSSQNPVTYGNVQTVSVQPGENNPVAQSDRYGMSMNSTLTVDKFDGLLFNDYEPNLDSYTIENVTNASHGVLDLNIATGAFEYTPNIGFTGMDSFTYNLVEDTPEALVSQTVDVFINVISGTNEAPTNITLSNKMIDASWVNGTSVGTLSTTDANVGDFHDYILTDSADGRFHINGDQILISNTSLIEVGKTYSIEVRSTDFNGLFFTKTFDIIAIHNPIVMFEENGGTTVESYSSVFEEMGISDNNDALTENTGDMFVHSADFDNDGNMDILLAMEDSGKIIWYENNGYGSFIENIISTTSYGVVSVYAVDLDNDGYVDVLETRDDIMDIFASILWHKNNGDGTFTEQTPIPATGRAETSIYSADIDNDGDMDVLSASMHDNTIAWYENNDDGTFTEQTAISTSAVQASSVYAADLDNDGDMDVLSASYSGDTIAWYENTDGEGTFGLQQIITDEAVGVRSVYAADLDNDGDMDVLSANQENGTIAWYENNGAGTFTEQTAISTSADDPRSVYAADLDNDGDIDVLSVSIFGLYKGVTWYENNGNGTFSTVNIISTAASGAENVYATDLNNDGFLDVISARQWFENEPLFKLSEPTDPTRAGYTFAGWYSDSGLTIAFDFNGTIQEDITLYANWTANEYDLVFDANNGTGSMTNQSITFDSSENLTANTYTRVGYTFTGWNTASDGSGTAYADEASFTMDVEGNTLYAQWTINQYTLEYKDYDGTVLQTEEFDYGSDLSGVTPPSDPTRTGYTFNGWDSSVPATMPANDITITVEYFLNPVITFEENGGTNIDSYSLTPDGVTFSTKIVISTSADGARMVYAADLDNDGDMDILSASFSDKKIAWYENNGDGIFGPQQVITTAAFGATSVYAADLDNDGDLDVLSASQENGTIAWYENNGDGTFGSLQTITTTLSGPYSVYAADLDNDGDMDVLSASYSDNTIAWYENNGDGTFGYKQVLTSSALNARSVYAVDLDNDGDIDVLSASYNDDTIAWYENNGNGTFEDQQVIATTANGATSVYAADLDNDGDMDVLSSSDYDDKIAWYENNGDGTFGTQQIITVTANGAFSVYSADVDNDGNMDVLSASKDDDTIAWYKNNGDGTFTEHTITTAVDWPMSVYAADLDNDGNLDVLSASYFDDTIAWYENDGFIFKLTEPTAPTKVGYTFDGWYSDSGLTTVFDFDSTISSDLTLYAKWSINSYSVDYVDHEDTVLQTENFDYGSNLSGVTAPTNPTREGYTFTGWDTSVPLTMPANNITIKATYILNPIVLFEENGGTTVESYSSDLEGVGFSETNVISTADGAMSVYAVDLDNDGDIDILSASQYDDTIAWYENNGDGTFSTKNIISRTGSGPMSVYAADLDNDGDMDVLVCSLHDSKIAWYENNGDGTFSSENIIPASASAPYAVYAADLDNDGDMDVLSASYGNDTIAWYKNNGDGTFTEQLAISTTAVGAMSVYAADLDNDGDMDVLSASLEDDTIVWYKNNGDGTFTEQTAISTTANGAKSVYAADLNNDGYMDVLSASEYDNTIAWYKNNGDGTFTEQTAISTTADAARSVYSTDLDNDGDMDVLSASYGIDTIAWYLNNGDGTFTEQTAISTTADGANSVYAADLDNDGDMDVLSASKNADTIAWYENDELLFKFTAPTDPSRTGYTFEGWYSDLALTTIFDFDSTITADITLYAQWTINEYTITFDSNGGSSVTAITQDYGTSLTEPTNPTKIGYTFNGWYSDSELTTVYIFTTMPAENLLLYAKWTINEYTVEYKDHDGTVLQTENFDYGSDLSGVTAPSDPTRVGYTFDAWSDTVPATTPAGDVTITATYTINRYFLKYVDYDGRVIQSTYAPYNSDLSGVPIPSDLIREGYTFTGWDSVAPATMPAYNTVITTTYTVNEYTITFDSNGGSSVTAITDEYGASVSAPTNPTRDGYTFDGWYSDSGLTTAYTFTNMPAENITVYAKWSINQYTVEYVDYDGTILQTEDINYGLDLSSITPPTNPTREGYIFTGWDTLVPLTMPANDITITATYSLKPIVIFEENGGTTVESYSSVFEGVGFSDKNEITTANGPFSIYAADLDNDGDIDVLVALEIDDSIVWFMNNGDGTFTEQTAISSTVDSPRSVYAADLDNDGDLDVLSASYNDNTISWFENNGNGTFGLQQVITSSASGARSVYATDLDNDGDVDVLSASYSDDTIAWYENNGDGTFTEHTITSTADGAQSVYAADLDNDGDMDVLSANIAEDSVAWYLNNGDGTFTEQAKISTTATGVNSVYAADLDNDGDIDVMSANVTSDTVAWYMNNGDGTFTEQTPISTTADVVRGIYAADLDNDGDMDVLSASTNDDSIAWYMNNGDGTFTEQTAISSTSDGAYAVYAADLDNDGDMDVLSVSVNDGSISWYENNELLFKLTAPTDPTKVGYTFVGWYSDIELTTLFDFNNIITADVTLYAKWSVNEYDVIFDANNGTGSMSNQTITFGTSENLTANTYTRVGYTFNGWNTVSDGSGDSYADEASFTMDVEGDTLYAIWTINQYTITFDSNEGSAVTAITEDYGTALSAPTDPLREGYTFNGWFSDSGLTSAYTFTSMPAENITVYAKWTINEYTLEYKDHDGTVLQTETFDYGSDLSGVTPPSDPTREDYTFIYWDSSVPETMPDSDIIITAIYLLDPIVTFEENGGTSIESYSIDLGGVTFSDENEITSLADGANSVYAADLDNDGYIDILSASLWDDTIAWYKNNGDGTFTEQTAISDKVDVPYSVYAADLNNDGYVDVLSASQMNNELTWYMNNGDGTFTEQTAISTSTEAGVFLIYAADLDNDGFIDVLSASGAEDTIKWYKNNGDGTFTEQTAISTSVYGAYSVYAADLDNDGDIDILSTSFDDDTVAWYENNGDGTFGLQQIITDEAVGVRSVYAADLDNDGFEDVLSASYSDDTVAWYKNNGDGTFTEQDEISITVDQALRVYAADLNNDGNIDVLSVSGLGDKVAWYMNNGDGTFTSEKVITTSGYFPRSVYAADLDNDGFLDVLLASSGDDKIAWYENYGIVFKLTEPTDPTRTGYTFAGWYTDSGLTIAFDFNSTISTDITLYANWTANEYDLVFDANNGVGTMANQTITFDTSETLTTNAYTRVGYTFTGWNTASDGSGNSYADEASFTMAVEGDTLYAIWTINQYTITFDSNGGSSVTAITEDYGTSVSEPANPTRTGYTFNGWYSDSELTSAYTFTSMPAENITVYAKWTANEYDVIFDANNGTGTMNNQTITFDTSENLTTNTYTRVGYTFNGWNTASDGSGTAYADEASFTMDVEGDTLYAIWTINEYTITFDSNGGSVVTAITEDYGTALSEPTDPNKTGYTFNGWYSDSELTSAYTFTSMPAENITVYAKWYMNTYDISYILDGGINGDNTSVYKVDTPTITLEDPSKEGYTFDGWFDSGDFAGKEITEITQGSAGDITLFAKWTANEYDLVFEANNGTGTMTNQSITFDSSESLTANAYTRDGYTFNGWNTASDGSGTAYADEASFTMDVEGDTLYAIWTINQYTITFDSNGGSAVTAITEDYGTALSEPTDPNKTGYTFNGWYSDSELTSAYTFTSMPAENITVYAKWYMNTYDISYILDGGINGDNTSVYKVDTPTITLEDPSKEGYTFDGWFDSGDFAGKEITEITQGSAGDITLFAKWTANEYDLVFEANNGTGTMTNQSITFDSSEILTANAYTRDGYTFNGWNTVSDGSGDSYADEASFTMDVEGDTLYAIWTINQYTITFDSNGGSAVTAITEDYGTALSEPTDPNKTGYTFNGWYSDSELTSAYTFTSMPAENITVYAKWYMNTYDISYILDGGINGDNTSVYKVDTPTITLEDPSKEGYTFDGWFDSGDFAGKEITEITQGSAGDITLFAKWSAEDYDVIFEANNGTGTMTNQTITFDTSETLTTNAYTRVGYTFTGWNTASDGSGDSYADEASFTMDVEGDTLYAIWTINQYTITFDSNEGSAVTAITEDYGTSVSEPANPTRTGYTFDGWYSDSELTSAYTFTSMPAENITVYAKWSINEYTITFDSNGGSAVTPITEDYGTALTAPTDPTRIGYTFTGWDVTIPETMPAENLTITATWSANEYDVVYDANNGTGSMENQTITFDDSENFTVNVFTREGYTYNGWNTAPDGSGTAYINGQLFLMHITGITLYAQWRINDYTVEYVDYDDRVLQTGNIYYGSDLSNVSAPADPSRVGYTFDGWDITLPETMPANKVTLTATYTINQYTVEYLDHDGTVLQTNDYDYGLDLSGVTPPTDPSRLGYTFDAWSGTVPATMGTSKVTVTATYTINQYTVEFVDHDGTVLQTDDYDYGSDLSGVTPPNDPSRVGYTFDGWDITIPETMPASTVTVTATYSINECTISFNSDGGSVVGSITDNYGSPITAPANPTKLGYTFNGWDVNLPSSMPENDLLLTALWTINQYTISFDEKGGTPVSDITQDFGTTITPPTDPTREGYTFNGWKTSIPTTMPSSDLTITATWIKEEALSNESMVEQVSGLIDAIDPSVIASNDVQVLLDVNAKTNNVISEEEAALVESIVRESVGNRTEYYSLDISLYYQIEGEELVYVTDANEMITITIIIPEEYRGYDEYYIVRIHDGESEILEATLNKENNTLTFQTDKFSTYSVVYETGASGWWYLLFLLVLPLGYLGYRYRDIIIEYTNKAIKYLKEQVKQITEKLRTNNK